jgi:DNA-binding CsgD family transcriptional regulator
MMESWDQIKGQDRLMAKVLANPGITFDTKDLYGRKERGKSEVYKKHSGRWGIEAVICTAQPDEKTGLVEGISLYRKKAEPGFSEVERQTKQALFPLLIQVWHHNQIQQLKHSSCGTDVGAFAISDPQGWLRHIDDRFMELIQQEFTGWHPPELPLRLLDWVSESSKSKYEGELVTVECWDQNDLILLQARSKNGLDKLTFREKEVAESYTAGLTYKEIAAELGVSPSTVLRHLESIFQKLEVSSKVELVHALN